MKLLRRSLPALVSAPLLMALAPLADTVSFKPADGAEVAKTLTVELEFNITDMEVTVGGQPLPAEMLGQIQNQTMLMNFGIGVSETYVSTKDGKPLELLRTYQKIDASFEGGGQSQSMDEMKRYEGRTVSFKWNEKEQDYDKAYHESEGDVKDLENVLVDMDVRALLPQKPVSKGDTWTVAADELIPVFMPGGMIGGTEGEDAAEFEEMRARLEEEFKAMVKDFKITCTYAGAREEEGTQVGEIKFGFEGKADMDLGSMISDIVQQQGGADVPEMDLTFNMGLELKGEGTLLWNLGAGVLYSYDMSADSKLDLDATMDMEAQGQQQNMTMSAAAEGTMTWGLKPDSLKK